MRSRSKSETAIGSNPITQGTAAQGLDPLSQNPNYQIVSNFDIRDSILRKEELSLLRTLYKFPEVVEAAALNYQPHLICNFLSALSQKFNSFYNNVPILEKSQGSRVRSQGQSSEGLSSEFLILNSNFRLALTAATSQILKNGLYLLGIHAPERM